MTGWLGPLLPVLIGHYLQTIFLVSFLLRVGPTLILYTVKKETLPTGKLTRLERGLFDPNLTRWPGVIRPILGLPR